jgi:ABC-type phosphate transport system substrate-binding protein
MKLFTSLLITAYLVTFSCQAVTVIVHPSNSDALDAKDVKKIFLGKSSKFPGGSEAIPVELTAGASRDEFLNNVVGKPEAKYKAYWSKRVFTGKGQAPRSLDSEAEIIALVSSNPNLIGYVSDGAVTDAVKAVGKF